MRERLINLLWLCIEQGGRILSSFLITILIVNHLGVEKFGNLSLGLAILTALGPIVGLGMDSILFKRFISRENNPDELIATSCYLRLIVSSLIILLTSVINYIYQEDFLDVLNVLVIGFIFDSFLSFKDYFAAHLKNKFYTYSSYAALLTQLLLLYVMVQINASLPYFALAYVASKFIQCLSLIVCFYNINNKLILPRVYPKLTRNLLVASYPMMLAASIGLLYSLQDQFFIKALLNEYELGIYAVGIKIVVILVVLPTMISNVFYPSLVSKFKSETKILYEQQLESIYLVFFVLGFSMFAVMYLCSDLLVDLLFDDEFARSSEIMKIYSALLVLSFFQSINNKILILNDLQHIIFKRALLALSINAGLNVILIPIFGITGAAYSTVLSECLVLFSYIFRKDTRFIFMYQLRAILLVNFFKSDLIKSLKA